MKILLESPGCEFVKREILQAFRQGQSVLTGRSWFVFAGSNSDLSVMFDLLSKKGKHCCTISMLTMLGVLS